MDVVYKITYLPHINTNYPKFYIGSKKNWKSNRNYLGSVASQRVFDFTNGKSIKDWWNFNTKQNKDDFVFEILESFEDISLSGLVIREREWQIKYDVISEEYFNQSLAICGFFSRPNSEETKIKKSLKTKLFWDTERGRQKKERLAKRNKETKSEEIRNAWKISQKLKDRITSGRPKGAKDLTARKIRREQKVCIEGVLYDNAKLAAKKYEIDVNNIRRRCRMDQYIDWNYI